MHEHEIYQFKENSDGFIDFAKHYIFKVHFWMTLIIIFLVGIYTVDIFSIGYLAGAFIFLWFGTDFYLKPLPKIIGTWNFMLMFNICIMIKNVLVRNFAGSLRELIPKHYCWFFDLFSLHCSINSNKLNQSFMDGLPLYADRIAFVFIIIQKRIFLSYYFYNIINETFASSVLASRCVWGLCVRNVYDKK